jgi:hypothetical protein
MDNGKLKKGRNMNEKGKGSACVPRAVPGVPPNTSSPGRHRAGRHTAHQYIEAKGRRETPRPATGSASVLLRRDETVALLNPPSQSGAWWSNRDSRSNCVNQRGTAQKSVKPIANPRSPRSPPEMNHKPLKISDLQHNQCSGQSSPVKVDQTDRGFLSRPACGHARIVVGCE